jgi:hypothetical protein
METHFRPIMRTTMNRLDFLVMRGPAGSGNTARASAKDSLGTP